MHLAGGVPEEELERRERDDGVALVRDATDGRQRGVTEEGVDVVREELVADAGLAVAHVAYRDGAGQVVREVDRVYEGDRRACGRNGLEW